MQSGDLATVQFRSASNWTEDGGSRF